MTREETVKIIRIMVDSYPNYKPNDISETVDVWHMMLSDYDYNLVAMALKAYILSDTSGFAPSIGQLVDKMKSITSPQELNEMEAWSLVCDALQNSGYNYAEEYAKLPPLVQKAVGLPTQLQAWALTENLNKDVVGSNFMRCYRIEVERQKEISKMPQNVREMLESISNGSYSSQIEQKRERSAKLLVDMKEMESKELGERRECVQMPADVKKRMDDWKNNTRTDNFVG